MLMLHAGAKPADYDDLRQLPVPLATPTHVPIPHHAVVDMVRYSLGFYGHEIVSEDFGVTRERIRQIEMAAMDKLRAALLADGFDPGVHFTD